MEHAEDGVQHFAGDRDEGLQLGFVACQQGLVESAQMRIMADRNQSGHVKGATQIAVARCHFLLHRTNTISHSGSVQVAIPFVRRMRNNRRKVHLDDLVPDCIENQVDCGMKIELDHYVAAMGFDGF